MHFFPPRHQCMELPAPLPAKVCQMMQTAIHLHVLPTLQWHRAGWKSIIRCTQILTEFCTSFIYPIRHVFYYLLTHLTEIKTWQRIAVEHIQGLTRCQHYCLQDHGLGNLIIWSCWSSCMLGAKNTCISVSLNFFRQWPWFMCCIEGWIYDRSLHKGPITTKC